jgi:hypothetical protein
MPEVEFEPTTPEFERAKAVYALDRAATAIATHRMCLRKFFIHLLFEREEKTSNTSNRTEIVPIIAAKFNKCCAQ